jgi:hypothetical protein
MNKSCSSAGHELCSSTTLPHPQKPLHSPIPTLVLLARDSFQIGIPVAICPEMVSCVFKEVEDGINRVVTFEGLSEGVDDKVYACLLSWTMQYQR